MTNNNSFTWQIEIFLGVSLWDTTSLGAASGGKVMGESPKRENERQKSSLCSHRTSYGSSTSTFIPTHQGEPPSQTSGVSGWLLLQ